MDRAISIKALATLLIAKGREDVRSNDANIITDSRPINKRNLQATLTNKREAKIDIRKHRDVAFSAKSTAT